MSLPTTAQLEALDFAFGGEPFCNVVSKSAVSAAGLDIAFGGEPFYAPSAGGVGPGPGGSPNITYIIGM